MKDHTDLILDGTKINWHLDRVEKWQRGEECPAEPECRSAALPLRPVPHGWGSTFRALTVL